MSLFPHPGRDVSPGAAERTVGPVQPVGRGSGGRPSRWRRWWVNPLARTLSLLALVVLLVVVTITLLLASARNRQTDDPRSTTRAGTAALAQLLTDQGVSVSATDQLTDAVRDTDARTTVVVADADRLTGAEAQQLLAAGAGRLVLLRPGTAALTAFGLTATGVDPGTGAVPPGCDDPDAVRAGSIVVDDSRAAYRAPLGAVLACYPVGSGYAQLRVRSGGTVVDLVAGGLANEVLAQQGNASFATALLGSQPKLVWLMAQPSAAGPAGAHPPCCRGGGSRRWLRRSWPWSCWGSGRVGASGRSWSSRCR